MATKLIDRFGHWLGTWRGPCDFPDGRRGVVQFVLSEIFNGEAIQLETVAYDTETGEAIAWGDGLLSLDRQGRAVDNIYGSNFGFAMLVETPDDPGVLSMEGPLPGNLTMDVTMSVVDDVLTLSTSISEGYRTGVARPRTYSRMARVGAALRAKGGES
jgi:hypothetical protein